MLEATQPGPRNATFPSAKKLRDFYETVSAEVASGADYVAGINSETAQAESNGSATFNTFNSRNWMKLAGDLRLGKIPKNHSWISGGHSPQHAFAF